jgi:hypothetical protein
MCIRRSVAALALAYFVAAKLGLELALISPYSTAVWPPTGIALAALLLWGYQLWPGVLIGALLANVTTGSVRLNEALTSILIAALMPVTRPVVNLRATSVSTAPRPQPISSTASSPRRRRRSRMRSHSTNLPCSGRVEKAAGIR